MYVCVCKAVSDRAIRDAVRGGAACVADVRRQTGLGTCCGKCVPLAREVIRQARGEQDGSVRIHRPALGVSAA